MNPSITAEQADDDRSAGGSVMIVDSRAEP